MENFKLRYSIAFGEYSHSPFMLKNVGYPLTIPLLLMVGYFFRGDDICALYKLTYLHKLFLSVIGSAHIPLKAVRHDWHCYPATVSHRYRDWIKRQCLHVKQTGTTTLKVTNEHTPLFTNISKTKKGLHPCKPSLSLPLLDLNQRPSD